MNQPKTYEFITKPCAICSQPIDGTKWYAVISERPVHQECFTASAKVGFTLKLK